jgi:hypothetical protein
LRRHEHGGERLGPRRFAVVGMMTVGPGVGPISVHALRAWLRIAVVSNPLFALT